MTSTPRPDYTTRGYCITNEHDHIEYCQLFSRAVSPSPLFYVNNCVVYTSTERYMREASSTMFIDCAFIVDCPRPAIALAAFNCHFHSEPEIERNHPVLSVNYCSTLGNTYSNNSSLYVHISTWVRYKDLVLAEKQKKVADKKQKLIKYAAREYCFKKTTVVCGIELEIPMSKTAQVTKLIDGRLWLATTDCSQIQGELEVVSRPLAFDNLIDCERRIERLYSKLKVPQDLDIYRYSKSAYEDKDLDDDDLARGSGIHVHFSWNDNYLSTDLREMLYAIVEEKGGERYLRKIGGKSQKNYDEYSPYKIHGYNGDKYDSFHAYSNKRLEMRWLANNPNPAVVAKRIRAAAALFAEAHLYMQTKDLVQSLDKCMKMGYARAIESKRLSHESQTSAG